MLKESNKLYLYFFVIGAILLVVCQALLTDGMFMDGVIYSAIANNLSNGIGSFWNLHFSQTLWPSFHEHPPLAIGMQSVFYTLLGHSRYIDKIYSLFTFVVSGYIILKIWKLNKFKNGWFVLLLWLSIPLVSWAISNNVLENTVTIFVLLSVFFLLKSQKQKEYLYLLLSGIMLTLGFLSKGFVAFFPLSLPFILWLVNRPSSFLKMMKSSLLLVLFTFLPLFILFLIFPQSWESISTYLKVQVVNGLTNIQEVKNVDSNFFIIERMFLELIPVIGICLIIMVVGFIFKFKITSIKQEFKTSLVYLLLGLTGVLPIMISTKQSGFYIMATFPFFAMAFAILLNKLIIFLFDEKFLKTKRFFLFKWFSIVVFIAGLIVPIYLSQTGGRDKEKLSDTYKILDVVPKGAVINANKGLCLDWTLQGYFSRYGEVSLDTNFNHKRDYILAYKDQAQDSLFHNYLEIKVDAINYVLLKKK
ncbi:MAG: hypothetical protein CVU05_03745 [Bacteroidetes bacterium HGW-Bacteroidetes-21]|jgi:4-amino-4-deoxy-L-arabinose transferase-like glycosyltransferase|nr:MAG: hypothetical protein CVU05_03745 [Bacteroidetes bacterium HGW-Bacteroidetes-21]